MVITKFGILSTQRIPGLGISSTQRIPEIGILSTQRIPGLRGLFTQEILLEKGIHLKKISRCAGNLFIVILSTQRIPGGDLVENGCFIEVKLANVCRFSDFARGTMREKMAILKERNRVCRGSKIFNGGDVDENRQFIEGKVVAHYQKLNILNGGDVMKIVILLRESWSHITKN